MAKNLGNDVARVWLRQSQDYGQERSGGRFYFQGDTIYSYGTHFPIAKLVTFPNGESGILFTTRTYSNTTAKHISRTWSAVRNSYRRVVFCRDPTVTADHRGNLLSFKHAMDSIATKHAKARKPELYAGDILAQAEMAREYCEVMMIEVPTWAQLPRGIAPGKALIAAMQVHQPEMSHV
jgi:hypothetical protein